MSFLDKFRKPKPQPKEAVLPPNPPAEKPRDPEKAPSALVAALEKNHDFFDDAAELFFEKVRDKRNEVREKQGGFIVRGSPWEHSVTVRIAERNEHGRRDTLVFPAEISAQFEGLNEKQRRQVLDVIYKWIVERYKGLGGTLEDDPEGSGLAVNMTVQGVMDDYVVDLLRHYFTVVRPDRRAKSERLLESE